MVWPFAKASLYFGQRFICTCLIWVLLGMSATDYDMTLYVYGKRMMNDLRVPYHFGINQPWAFPSRSSEQLSQTQVRQPSYPTQIVRSRIVISHAISNEQVN